MVLQNLRRQPSQSDWMIAVLVLAVFWTTFFLMAIDISAFYHYSHYKELPTCYTYDGPNPYRCRTKKSDIQKNRESNIILRLNYWASLVIIIFSVIACFIYRNTLSPSHGTYFPQWKYTYSLDDIFNDLNNISTR